MREIEMVPNCPTNSTPRRRRSNVLRVYINRINLICLLNVLAALVFAVIYTGNHSREILVAMYVCEFNALIAWLFAR